MVNVKAPVKPVQKRGLWPPKNGREYPVLDTDDWWKIAARFHPTIARQELQKKTRPSCREALPTSA